jgi:hypothetical protein
MFLALAGVTVAAVFTLRADDPAQSKNADNPAQVASDLSLREQILSRQFTEFRQSLLKLMQRLRASPKQEDRERAVMLQKALDVTTDKGLEVQFEQLVEALKQSQLKSVGDIKSAADRSAKIAENLREILDLLRQDTRTAKLREERLSLEKLIKELEKVIHDQKVAEMITRRGKTEKNELAKIQNKVTEATTKIAQKLGSKLGKGGEAKKGQAKDPGKGEGKKGEAKDAGSTKKASSKDAGKQKAKTGEAKGNKADSKPGEPKESKGGGAKKGGEGKKGDAKSGKGGDSKSDAKSGGSKSKQGDAKSDSKSSGQGQAKSGGGTKPAEKKADNQKQPPPPPQQPQAAQNNGKKQVEDANYKQKQAEDEIAKGKNKEASDNETEAIRKLEEARKKLEDLLRQLREEELERLLANLQARCEKMLAMQMQVLAGTEGISRSIESHKDKKAARNDQQQSLRLSDDEKEIVVEATKAIEILEAEGSAVAFPEVFKQVREDMKHVQRRLGIVDVGTVTQAIEKDIIDTLKEMIEALKKARQELDNKKSPPSQSGPPPDQKLLDKIAELKMILAMQIRVNTRTRVYGRQYQGEQAADPNIAHELRGLSERQERIFEVTNRIAKGDNR